jgi:uncharacterized protein
VSAEAKANRLIHETSPYLLQHAHNPVDWYPWGEEAFKKARAEDKPIFLSVGYSSCHWCHVMEHESFEDEEVARLLNESFISIKVDREERPDVDAIYMASVQMMTHSGGWPMTVFLTPELKPFFAGTYFPPESKFGRPGFKEVLRQLAKLWKTDRKKVDDVAGNVTQALKAEDVAPGVETARGAAPPGPEVFDGAFQHFERSFDPEHGGFGSAPKFPRAVDLSVLLVHFQNTGSKRALEMADLTLRKMAGGGMYDQVGGGFHRYSTDERWLVPHFEKMLYDNALLARTYLEAYQVTGQPAFQRVAREILDYVLREMTSPAGGFYSATDADSPGGEGEFFVWSLEEVEEKLGKERAAPFAAHYGITREGNFEGKSILHTERTVQESARALSLAPEKLEEVLREGREILYREREKREKPFRDEKVIAGWNGLMLSALALGSRVVGERRWLEAAVKNGDLIARQLIQDGKLHRIWKDARTKLPGYLDDHAYVIQGLLDLHQASLDPAHLDLARALAERMLADFWDPSDGGFFFTADHHQDLIARRKDPFDGATPSPNGVAALDLLRLGVFTGEKKWREKGEALLAGMKVALERLPFAFGSTLLALDFYLRPSIEIAVVGDPATPEAGKARGSIGRRFLPRLVLSGAPAKPAPELEKKIPLLEGKSPIGGKTTVYICRNYACEAPITEIEKLDARLEEIARPGAK